MAEASGRDLVLKRSTDSGSTYAAVAAIRSKSVSIANEPVDITSDDSDAWRTLLDEPGNRTIDISFSGVFTDVLFLAQIMAATSSVAHEYIQLLYPSGATLTGRFMLNNMSYSGEYNGAAMYDGSLQSSGAIVYAAS